MRNRSRAFLVLVLVVAACGGRTRRVGEAGSNREPGGDRPTSAPADAGAIPPSTIAAAHLSLELAGEDRTVVRLVVTDETGATQRSDLAELAGPCTDVTSSEREDGTPILAARCDPDAGRGALLHVVVRGNQAIALRDWTDDAELAFDEIRRVDLPPGARITTDYD